MRKSLIVMGALLLALLGGWYHHQHHHFIPNTYINQVDVSGLTTESATTQTCHDCGFVMGKNGTNK
ncbi:hypothetical protein, partial [Ligilactobacillus equi]|uniref:hypothetical protein n=1 Tax=Ligilactobacillus equi TaxID=137357 RepID=UPI000556E174